MPFKLGQQIRSVSFYFGSFLSDLSTQEIDFYNSFKNYKKLNLKYYFFGTIEIDIFESKFELCSLKNGCYGYVVNMLTMNVYGFDMQMSVLIYLDFTWNKTKCSFTIGRFTPSTHVVRSFSWPLIGD